MNKLQRLGPDFRRAQTALARATTVNHWWTKRRVAALRQAGFGYRDLLLVPEPEAFQSTGFQLGAMHVEKGYDGPLTIRYVG